MDLPGNKFKSALKNGERQIGLWCTIPDSSVVEMLAACGYDWLLIDTEHSPLDVVGTVPLMQAAASFQVSTVVRVPWNDAVQIKKALDCGAQTLLVPFVQNAQEAAAAVAAVRYPPAGIRGVAGTTRASRYGMIKNYVNVANDEIGLLVQVETTEALAEIEAIAAIDGIDGIFIGPADLAASMGLPGQPSHPDVKSTILDAVERIKSAGKPAGILSLDQSFLKDVDQAGAQFIAVGLDLALLRDAARTLRTSWS